MRFLRPVLIPLLALSLLSFPRPVSLVKISKGTPGLIGILKAFQIDVLQELDTCFLAKTSRGEISVLRRQGIAVSVLDRDYDGKEHFLIAARSPAQLALLEERGSLREVEPNLFLFWVESGDPLTLLPFDIERKSLPSSSILPSRPSCSNWADRRLWPMTSSSGLSGAEPRQPAG
jgi:hypothetical protein